MSATDTDDPSGDYDPTVPGSAPHEAPVDTDSDPLVTVVVPAGADQGAIARALLEAAKNPADVQYGGDGFVVPQSVAEAANLDEDVETVKGLATEQSAALGDTSQPAALAEIDRQQAEDADDPDAAGNYEALSVKDLDKVIRERNADREDDAKISTAGKKDDKVAALYADDQAAIAHPGE